MWHVPAMRWLAVYTIFGFTGFFVTMSALPKWLALTDTAESLAGFVTTVLLAATVSTQAIVPRLVSRFGMAATLALGLVALGAPSLLFLIDGNYGWILVICALRGIGFGAMTVLGAMLTAQIVAPARRGEAVGIYGLAIAVPNLLAVPGGVALVNADLFWAVALLGAAPLLGLPAVRGLARAAERSSARASSASGGYDVIPGEHPPAAATPATADSAPQHTGAAQQTGAAKQAAAASRAAARKAALGPACVLMVVTLTSGGFMTYVPIARQEGALATVALLTWGLFGALTRWRIGPLADRTGLRTLLPGTSVLSIIGIGLVALGLPMQGAGSWAVILIGSAVLGTGFGGTQNLTLVAAFLQARQRETATVSSVWNIGFDTGTAIGSGLVGLLLLAMTIPPALALTAILIVASMPLAIRAARPPRAD